MGGVRFLATLGCSKIKGCLRSSFTLGLRCGSLRKQTSRKFLRLGETRSLFGSFGGSVALPIDIRTDTISLLSDQGGLPTRSSNTVQPRLQMSAYLL